MEHRYSSQAKAIINNLKDFDKKEFEIWFEKQLIVGGGNIVDFLRQKEEYGDINGMG